jgi:hypothetical protein
MVVAFLFTIENGIVHEDIWKAFFKYVPDHCYRVFVHARQPSRLVEGSMAQQRLIDVNITADLPDKDASDVGQYAKVRDNYDAQRLLLTKALQHEDTTNFFMCDADSVPLKSFQQLVAYTSEVSEHGKYSLAQFCPHQIKTEAGRKVLHMAIVKYLHALREHPGFASDIALTNWYWASKFVVYARHHAQSLVDDESLCQKLVEYGITNVSTHYPMLMLSKNHPDEIVNVPTTMEAWNKDGSVKVFDNITPECEEALSFANLLLGTGFSSGSGLSQRISDIWAAPVAVDPNTGETAEFTGM